MKISAIWKGHFNSQIRPKWPPFSARLSFASLLIGTLKIWIITGQWDLCLVKNSWGKISDCRVHTFFALLWVMQRTTGHFEVRNKNHPPNIISQEQRSRQQFSVFMGKYLKCYQRRWREEIRAGEKKTLQSLSMHHYPVSWLFWIETFKKQKQRNYHLMRPKFMALAAPMSLPT